MPNEQEELLEKHRIYKIAAKRKAAQEAQRLALDNQSLFIEKVAGLYTYDRGDSNPYFDIHNPESPYAVMNEFLDDDSTNNWKFLAAGRKTGKTYFVQQKLLHRIMVNRDLRVMIGGESTDKSIDRGEWLRGRLEINEETYGPFHSPDWKKGHFTINRPTGLGGYPTVMCTGPEKAQTGGHPDIMWLDDVVGEIAFESILKQQSTVKWLREKLMFQMGPTTQLWVTGTMWPGAFHLYRYIYDEVEGKPQLDEIAPGAWYHKGKQFDILSFDSGYQKKKPVFPCLPMKFLERQFALNPVMSKCQYDNRMLDNSDVAFTAQQLGARDLPEGEPFKAYMLTDMSGTKKGGYKTSTSCMVIVALTANDHAYVLYARVGKFHPDAGPAIILDMLDQCKSERNITVENIWFENTGPGAMYPSLIRKEAEVREVDAPTIREVHRPTDTHQRILAFLLNPVQQLKLHFTPSVSDNLFKVEEGGEPSGEIAHDFLSYSYSGEGKPDILDAFADIWATEKGGARMCEPPAKPNPEEEFKLEHTEQYFRILQKKYDEDYGGSKFVD